MSSPSTPNESTLSDAYISIAQVENHTLKYYPGVKHNALGYNAVEKLLYSIPIATDTGAFALYRIEGENSSGVSYQDYNFVDIVDSATGLQWAVTNMGVGTFDTNVT